MARHTTWPDFETIPPRRGPLFEDTAADERELYLVPRGDPGIIVPRGSVEQRVTEQLYDAVAGMSNGDAFLIERDHARWSNTGSEFTMTRLLQRGDRFARMSDIRALLGQAIQRDGFTVGTAVIMNLLEDGLPPAGRMRP